jgi:catalase
LAGINPDYATEDLFNHIAKGGEAAWKFYVQIMRPEDEPKYRFNVFDITKVWPHSDYPLIPVGRLVLNRNPENFFAEVEQAAFSPSHLVPGIEASPDKMLQGRLFSYPDTHRHRLGVNYQQIPVNCPFAVKGGVRNYMRDGFMVVNGNQGKGPNYTPNTFNGPRDAGVQYKEHRPVEVHGVVDRYRYNHPNCDFEQPGVFYRKVLTPEQRTRLVNNIVGHMKNVTRRDIQVRAIRNFYKADPEYGSRIAQGVGIDVSLVSADGARL